MDPHSIDEEDEWKYPELAKLLGISVEKLKLSASKKIRTSGNKDDLISKVRWIKLKDEVDEGTYRKIQFLRIKGVYGNFKHSRIYPNRNLASHLLGFVNKEGVAAMGVERLANYYLKGQDGWKESEKDGKRKEMPEHRILEVSPQNGLNVELSIDWMIQDMVQKELARIVEEYNPPCLGMSKNLAQKILDKNGNVLDETLFLQVAKYLRGLVGVVEVPGMIHKNDEFLIIP